MQKVSELCTLSGLNKTVWKFETENLRKYTLCSFCIPLTIETNPVGAQRCNPAVCRGDEVLLKAPCGCFEALCSPPPLFFFSFVFIFTHYLKLKLWKKSRSVALTVLIMLDNWAVSMRTPLQCSPLCLLSPPDEFALLSGGSASCFH